MPSNNIVFIGEVQKNLNFLTAKALVCFIYEKLKQNIVLKYILTELKIAIYLAYLAI